MSSPSGPTALKMPTSFEKKVLTSLTSLESPTLSIFISPLAAVVLKTVRALSTPKSKKKCSASKTKFLSGFPCEDIFRMEREHVSDAEIVAVTPDFFLRPFR
jgi:hypothetical protein